MNKKEKIAALNKETILHAAEKLFLEKGVAATTIDDISKLSEYSRRTIYVYFKDKDDILHHIVLNGLLNLQENLSKIIQEENEFFEMYRKICKAIENYLLSSPQSADSVIKMKRGDINLDTIPPIFQQILDAGTVINDYLAKFVEKGKEDGIVCEDIVTMKSVYIMWSSLVSLITMVENKGSFFETVFSEPTSSFLDAGYRQIINGILINRI